MELQSWVGALRGHMLKVMELVESKVSRITEADVRNAGMSQDATGDLKDMDRMLYQLLVACTKGEAKNDVCNTEWSDFMAERQMDSQVTLIPEQLEREICCVLAGAAAGEFR